MQFVIDDFGAFIGKKQNLIEVRRKDKTEECSADSQTALA